MSCQASRWNVLSTCRHKVLTTSRHWLNSPNLANIVQTGKYRSQIFSEWLLKRTGFDEVFAESFPDVVANVQSKINRELSENEERAFSAQDTTFQLHSDDSGSPVSVQTQAKQANHGLKMQKGFDHEAFAYVFTAVLIDG